MEVSTGGLLVSRWQHTQFRDQCEELRATKFKTHLIEVTKDRDEQLRLKSEEQERKKKGIHQLISFYSH